MTDVDDSRMVYVPKHRVKNGEIVSDDSDTDSRMSLAHISDEEEKDASPINGSFDFLTSATMEPLCVGVVLARIAARRRPPTVPRDATREEFTKILGIAVEDTKDPDNKTSFLNTDEGVRSYYGDSEDEAYKWFRENMLLFSEDESFVKERSFLDWNLQREYENMKQFENMALAQKVADDSDANALEAEFYKNLRSKAHTECLEKYRSEKKNTQVPQRLCFEQKRREEEERSARRRKVPSGPDECSVAWKYKRHLLHMHRGGLRKELLHSSREESEENMF